MSLWDYAGFGETHTADGCFVVRYEDGRVVEHMGPYDTERKSENARHRWRNNELNAADRKLITAGPVIERYKRSTAWLKEGAV